MRVSLHPDAEADVAEAIAFYDGRRAGLGSDFLSEFLGTCGRVGDAPEAWPMLEKPVRRCLVERFPYAVYYRIDPGEIVVLAVMHTRRKPGAWKSRQ